MKWCCIYKKSHNIRRIYDSYKEAYWNEMFQSDVCYGRDTKIVPYTKNIKYKEFLKELDTYDNNYWISIFLFGIIPLKIYKKTKFKKIYYEKYCDIFRVETGWRHCDIMRKFPGQLGNIWQTGFLTNKCRYVGREEAWDIAKKNGQIDPNKIGDTLFSEDIY